MRTIEECIAELKTRRDWKNVEEVETVFDEILEIHYKAIDDAVTELEESSVVTMHFDGKPTTQVVDLDVAIEILRKVGGKRE